MGKHGYSELVKVILKTAQEEKCINLQKLNLYSCSINTEKLIALSPALPFIDEVNLSGNELIGIQRYSEVVKVVVKANKEAAQEGKHINLQKLDLYNCGVTTEELTALSPALPYIYVVNLSENRQTRTQWDS